MSTEQRIPPYVALQLLKHISTDDFASFMKHINENQINLNSFIPRNLPGVNTILCDGPPIIACAAYFQANTIFDFLMHSDISLETPKTAFPCKPIIHYAIAGLHPRMIEALLKRAVDMTFALQPSLRYGFRDLSEGLYEAISEGYPNLLPSEIFKIGIMPKKDPLKLAIRSGDIPTVLFVIDTLKEQFGSYSDFFIFDNKSNTLHVSSRKLANPEAYKELIELFVERDPGQLIQPCQKLQLPIHLSLDAQHSLPLNPAAILLLNMMQSQLSEEQFADALNSQDINGMTPLHYAAKNGYEEAVEFLLSDNCKGVQKNIKDKLGNTPFIYAVHSQYVNVVARFLVFEKDNPDLIGLRMGDRLGRCPIHIAARNNWKWGFQELCEFDPTLVQYKDYCGMSPMMWAAVNGSSDIFDYLLSEEVFFLAIKNDRTDDTGNTILHFLALYGHINIIEKVIASHLFDNIDVLAEEPQVTPLYYAAKKGYEEICEILVRNGARINFKVNNNIVTPEQISRTVQTCLRMGGNPANIIPIKGDDPE